MIWFVWEACGVACGMFTYAIVLIVQVGFIRIGLWEQLLAGELSAYIHLAVF